MLVVTHTAPNQLTFIKPAPSLGWNTGVDTSVAAVDFVETFLFRLHHLMEFRAVLASETHHRLDIVLVVVKTIE